MKLIFVFIALVISANSAAATQASYRCADGTTVNANFSKPGPAGSVKLTFAGKSKSVSLPQAPSADGGRYGDGSIQFWIKGKTAQLTRAGAQTECTTP